MEFRGVVSTEREVRIGLADTQKGTSAWVKPGLIFSGYVLRSYDAKNNKVVLNDGTTSLTLALIPVPSEEAIASGNELTIDFGEKPLASVVSAEGFIRLPLVGQAKVAGLSCALLQSALRSLYRERFPEGPPNLWEVTVRR